MAPSSSCMLRSHVVSKSATLESDIVESEKENVQPYNQTVEVVHASVSFGNAELMSLGLYLYS